MIAHLLCFWTGDDVFSETEEEQVGFFLRSVHNFDIDLRQKISYNTYES